MPKIVIASVVYYKKKYIPAISNKMITDFLFAHVNKSYLTRFYSLFSSDVVILSASY